jgi:hypothetical protein
MPDDLMAHTRKQPERSSSPVRAAAGMRIARVQSTTCAFPTILYADGFDRNRER